MVMPLYPPLIWCSHTFLGFSIFRGSPGHSHIPSPVEPRNLGQSASATRSSTQKNITFNSVLILSTNLRGHFDFKWWSAKSINLFQSKLSIECPPSLIWYPTWLSMIAFPTAGDCSDDDRCIELRLSTQHFRNYLDGGWTVDLVNEKAHDTTVKSFVIILEYK